MDINNATRNKIEKLIYEVMDKLDKTKTNSEHYKKIFANMDNKQFAKFLEGDFPFRFHVKPFVIEPTMEDINNACDHLKVPLLEKIKLPYYYKNADGIPVNSQECLVGYVHLKKVQQFITKKNAMSTNIDARDMKTGLLTGHDKNGKTSDREMESLAALGLKSTMKEFSKARADSLDDKNVMYNTISNIGDVSLKDLPDDPTDSLSKNLLNTYLIGAHISSNLINTDYYLPITVKNKKKGVQRV